MKGSDFWIAIGGDVGALRQYGEDNSLGFSVVSEINNCIPAFNPTMGYN
jgi:hypothetical protein